MCNKSKYQNTNESFYLASFSLNCCLKNCFHCKCATTLYRNTCEIFCRYTLGNIVKTSVKEHICGCNSVNYNLEHNNSPHNEHRSSGPRPHDEHRSSGPRPHDEHRSSGTRPHDEHRSSGTRPHDEHRSSGPRPVKLCSDQ